VAGQTTLTSKVAAIAFQLGVLQQSIHLQKERFKNIEGCKNNRKELSFCMDQLSLWHQQSLSRRLSKTCPNHFCHETFPESGGWLQQCSILSLE
jgi:hypothetical protein